MADETPGRPMTTWTVIATCPACAGPLSHVADGAPGLVHTQAIATCSDCGRWWKAELRLSNVTVDLGHRARHPRTCDCHVCKIDRGEARPPCAPEAAA